MENPASDRDRLLIIPAFNEAERLPRVLAQVAGAVSGFEVVVVDDGSSDGTAERAAEGGARVLRHPFNLGYGAALQTGYKYARRKGASLLVQMDADGQHNPRDIPGLVRPIERGECDLVVGSRFGGAEVYGMSLAKRVGGMVFRAMARLYGVRITDPTSGFQAMNRSVVDLYTSDAFPSDFPDVDVLLFAHRYGLRIGERPVAMNAGTRPSSIHRRLTPIYYTYRMLLAIWAVSARKRRPSGPQEARTRE